MAEGLEGDKKIVDARAKKKSHRKNEGTEKGNEMIKMVIKRVTPSKGSPLNQAATYEISKIKKSSELNKKKLAPKKINLEGKDFSLKQKHTTSSKLKDNGIPKKKVKFSFNSSASSAKS